MSMAMVEILSQVHENGWNASLGPWQWLKSYFSSMTMNEMLVQVYDDVWNVC